MSFLCRNDKGRRARPEGERTALVGADALCRSIETVYGFNQLRPSPLLSSFFSQCAILSKQKTNNKK